MITPAKISIKAQLIIWLSVFIISIGITLVLINSYIFSSNLHKNINKKTSLTCEKLAIVLVDATWNIDIEAMGNYFEAYPWELSGMARVTIYTEFDDPIYTVKFKDANDLSKCRQPIYHDNDLIGFIEVSIDQTRQTSIKYMVFRFWIISMVAGLIIIFTVTLFIFKKLIGNPIKLLMKGLAEIESGNIDYRFPEVNNSREALMIATTVDTMSVEIGKRSRQLKQENAIRKATEAKLKEFTNSLEEQVQQRTRSLQKAYKALQKESKERFQLQNEILSISDREQQRIGNDLHDSLGQQLTGVSLLLSILTKTLQKNKTPEAESALALEKQMKVVIKEARNLSHGLSPLRLNDDGLIPTLQKLANDTEYICGITCNFECTDEANVFTEVVAMHLYRIIQEAINNAHKHGNADVINITMNTHPDYKSVSEIHIEDNGCGIAESQNSSDGIGLRIMHFRAESIGGLINITKNKLGGTTVKVTYTNTDNHNN